MSKQSILDCIVVGSGPCGYTASIYLSRAGLNPLLITGESYGGQLMYTTDIENFPGFSSIKGEALMEQFHKQSEKFGTQFEIADVNNIKRVESYFEVETNNKKFLSRSIILCTGCKSKLLGLENEMTYFGNGISTCSTCDGFFYKNKDVIMVGGGDSAMEEAIFLTKFANKVFLIHRSKNFRASKIMLNRAKQNEKIEFITDTVVKNWVGTDEILSGAIIHNNITGEEKELKIDGSFIAIGHNPTSKFVQDLVNTDDNGYVLIDENMMTNVPGIFAAGDLCDHKYRQAITSAADGCKAALDCEKWLSSQ